MTLIKPAKLYLQIRLFLGRSGWVISMAWMLIISGIVGAAWYIPYLQKQAKAPLERLQQAQSALQVLYLETQKPAIPIPEQRLKAFYELLGDNRYAEQQVKTLFAVAGKSGLQLNQAEYKSAYDKNGATHTYQVILPVKGRYEAIRIFCEQTLLTIPFASLDEISFKRDAVNNQTLEAKLRFSFYLADPKEAGSSEQLQTPAVQEAKL